MQSSYRLTTDILVIMVESPPKVIPSHFEPFDMADENHAQRSPSSKPIMSEDEWLGQSRHTSPRHVPEGYVNAISPGSPLTAKARLQNHLPRWSKDKENILVGPYEYMAGHPGKDIRAQLIAAFNVWLKVPPASLSIINKVVSILHTASLLVDDVEDSSLLRRGIPVAHSIFGTAQTINSANYMYFCALQELATLNNPHAVQVYTTEMLNLHRGQGMDLYWRDTLTCPSEADYLEMVGNKTGGLFRLAIKLMQAESPTDMDCVELVNVIGLIFQIVDDYKNLSDNVYTANKGLCEDLTEGKFSFPVIHSIRADPENLVLINILKQKTTDDRVKRYATSYMEQTGSFAYTRQTLNTLTKQALALVEALETGHERGDGLRAILDKIRISPDEGRPDQNHASATSPPI